MEDIWELASVLSTRMNRTGANAEFVINYQLELPFLSCWEFFSPNCQKDFKTFIDLQFLKIVQLTPETQSSSRTAMKPKYRWEGLETDTRDKMPFNVIPYISHKGLRLGGGTGLIRTHNMSLERTLTRAILYTLYTSFSFKLFCIIILFASPNSPGFIECKNYSLECRSLEFMSIL